MIERLPPNFDSNELKSVLITDYWLNHWSCALPKPGWSFHFCPHIITHTSCSGLLQLLKWRVSSLGILSIFRRAITSISVLQCESKLVPGYCTWLQQGCAHLSCQSVNVTVSSKRPLSADWRQLFVRRGARLCPSVPKTDPAGTDCGFLHVFSCGQMAVLLQNISPPLSPCLFWQCCCYEKISSHTAPL